MELLQYRRNQLRKELDEYFSALVDLSLAQPGEEGIIVPPKPWVLTLLEDVEAFGVLWEGEGLGDQPVYLMGDLRLAADVRATYQVRPGASTG